MKITALAAIDIPAPVERAFAVATDQERLAQLLLPLGPIPGVLGVELVDAPAPAPGVRRRVRMSDRTEVLEEVLAFDPPHRHRYRWVNPPAFPFSLLVSGGEADWVFTSQGSAARIEWRYTFTLTSPLVWPAVAVLRLVFARWMAAALARVRAQAV